MAEDDMEGETPDPSRFAWGKNDIVVTRRGSDDKKDEAKSGHEPKS